MSLAKFKKEPLTEVVFGVEFDSPDFSSVHFGLYWQTISNRFPVFPLDRPPVGEMPLLTLPPLRRVWFESENREQLIQLQEDRFYYNWRRKSPDEKYPHYEEIAPIFFKEWESFRKWRIENNTQSPRATRYELTYLNTIDEEFGWSCVDDYSKVFSIVSGSWEDLPLKQEAIKMGFEFTLPEEIGHLTVSIDQSTRPDTNLPIVLLRLTAASNDTSVEIEQWFKAAHESIVQIFISMVSKNRKEEWGFQWLEQR